MRARPPRWGFRDDSRPLAASWPELSSTATVVSPNQQPVKQFDSERATQSEIWRSVSAPIVGFGARTFSIDHASLCVRKLSAPPATVWTPAPRTMPATSGYFQSSEAAPVAPAFAAMMLYERRCGHQLPRSP